MNNNLQIGTDKSSVSSCHPILSAFGDVPFLSIFQQTSHTAKKRKATRMNLNAEKN
jgi:hypothetical protein